MEERGIPCSLEEAEDLGIITLYHLWVAKEDAGQSFEDLQREFMTQKTHGESLAAALPSIDECPACHSQVSPDAKECPSCGLALSYSGEEPGSSERLSDPGL